VGGFTIIWFKLAGKKQLVQRMQLHADFTKIHDEHSLFFQPVVFQQVLACDSGGCIPE